jgi:hypothetical protein
MKTMKFKPLRDRSDMELSSELALVESLEQELKHLNARFPLSEIDGDLLDDNNEENDEK